MKTLIYAQERDDAKAAFFKYSQNRMYYDQQRDEVHQRLYYRHTSLHKEKLHRLLEATHHPKLSYAPHRYLYTWVDLQENMQLKSLYSGKKMDPLEVIEADIRIMEASTSDSGTLNCEHVVPQSWFDKQEPMRGDLHHLFACEPTCNSRRGNHPYFDFYNYTPEMRELVVKEGCGKLEEGKFEPEYGKGIVARATLYFLLRYPGVIPKEDVDLDMLLRWHDQFPVSLYEKHRNLAIYELQGNRNPVIDFPESAELLF